MFDKTARLNQIDGWTEYMAASNVVHWVEACCTIDPKMCVTREDAYDAYCAWCVDMEMEAATTVWFARDLRNQVPEITDGKIGGKRAYRGFAIKPR